MSENNKIETLSIVGCWTDEGCGIGMVNKEVGTLSRADDQGCWLGRVSVS